MTKRKCNACKCIYKDIPSAGATLDRTFTSQMMGKTRGTTAFADLKETHEDAAGEDNVILCPNCGSKDTIPLSEYEWMKEKRSGAFVCKTVRGRGEKMRKDGKPVFSFPRLVFWFVLIFFFSAAILALSPAVYAWEMEGEHFGFYMFIVDMMRECWMDLGIVKYVVG